MVGASGELAENLAFGAILRNVNIACRTMVARARVDALVSPRTIGGDPRFCAQGEVSLNFSAQYDRPDEPAEGIGREAGPDVDALPWRFNTHLECNFRHFDGPGSRSIGPSRHAASVARRGGRPGVTAHAGRLALQNFRPGPTCKKSDFRPNGPCSASRR